MRHPKKELLIFLLIFLLASLFRVLAYRPISGSLGVQDTKSYINSAELPFSSWAFLTSSRAPTLPLVFKLFQPAGGYAPAVMSEPAVLKSHPQLVNQPGYDRIVIFQLVVSILCWGMLALSLFRHMSNLAVGIGATILIFLFAFTPQTVDWDQLLISESLSFSLFALTLALVIEYVFLVFWVKENRTWQTITTAGLLFIVLALWVFTRDTNTFLIPLTIVFGLPGLYFLARRRAQFWVTLALLVSIAGLYALQQTSFQASKRWLQPFLNNVTANVFPYPTRVAFFAARGMPVSKELLATRGSMEYNHIQENTEFMGWAEKNGLSTYTSFLMHTPVWAGLNVYNNISLVFNENLQPYFPEDARTRPVWLVVIGDMLHPLSGSVVLIDFLFVILLIWLAIKTRSAQLAAWGWIGFWLFFSSLILMALGITGEVRSIIRHAMVGVVPLRLALWVLLAVLADVLLTFAPDKVEK